MFFSLDEIAEMVGTTKQRLAGHAFRGNLRVTHFRCSRCRKKYGRGYVTPEALDKFREYLRNSPNTKTAFGNEELDLNSIPQEGEENGKLPDIQAAQEPDGGRDERE